jgi:hypothetical protein
MGSTKEFIEVFQRVAVMVPDMSKSRLLVMYIEGFTEPLHGWVNAFKPITLQDVIECTRYLIGETYKNKVTPRPPIIPRGRETKQLDKGKGIWMKLLGGN